MATITLTMIGCMAKASSTASIQYVDTGYWQTFGKLNMRL